MEGKSLDNQTISIRVFIIAVVCGVSLSLTRASQPRVAHPTFIPLFRVSVDLGVRVLALRPYDVLVFIILVRVILSTPAAPMRVSGFAGSRLCTERS